MWERWMQKALGVRMTIVSGLFVAVSAYYHIIGEHPVWDPGWITLLISGVPIVYGALYWLFKEKTITSWLLITVAMVACVSLDEVFAAAEVAWIIAIGEILEAKTVSRARRGLTELLSQAPTQGRRVNADGKVEEVVAAEEIAVGDILRILPGETIPVDGIVVSGTTAVNEAMLTGESLPADKQVGAEVYSGTTNGFGSIDIRATKVGEDSSMQRLVRLVKEASEQQAPVQRIVDRWVVYLIPAAIAFAILTFAINLWWGTSQTDALYRAVTVLVVFCPCALALATPTSVVAAIGQATKSGVIVKSGAALEEMGRIDTIAFDKTGTITSGKLAVVEAKSLLPDLSVEDMLRVAAAVEARSEHPLGKALLAEVQRREIDVPAVEEFEMESGRGVKGVVAAKTVLVGSESYLTQHGVAIPDAALAEAENWRREGKIIIWVAQGQDCIGIVGFADTLRNLITPVIDMMRRQKMRTVMLTGDNAATAAYVGGMVGVDEVNARLMPEDKAAYIGAQQRDGHRIAMVGDGVNDAAALRMANVGIAMGDTAGDMAMEAADIVMPGEDVTRLTYLVKLSQATLRTIHINIIIALGLNIAGVVLSIIGWLTPVTGAIIHNAGSILVALHAISLYERKFDKGLRTDAKVADDHCVQVKCIECGHLYCANPTHHHPTHQHA